MAKAKQAHPNDMSARIETFCEVYICTFNGAESARRAGYAVRNAKRQATKMLADPRVQKRLGEMQAERRIEHKATADSVIERTNEVVNRCMAAAEVRDRKGNIVEGEWTFDAAGALRGLDLLGKHFGIFNTRIDISLSEEKTRESFRQYLEIVHAHVSKDQFAAILADLEAVEDA